MRHTATQLRPWILLTGILIALAAVTLTSHPRTVARTPAPPARVVASVPAAPAAALAPRPTRHARPVATAATPQATPLEAGLRAYLDPETGTYGPPPIGVGSEFAPAALEPTPVEIRLPDGSVMIDMKGGGQEYLIVQLDEHGRRVLRCVDDPRQALAAPVPAPAPQREER